MRACVYLVNREGATRARAQARHDVMMQCRGETCCDRAMRRPFVRSTAIGWGCYGIWEKTRSRWMSFRPCGRKAGVVRARSPESALQQTVSPACQSTRWQQALNEAASAHAASQNRCRHVAAVFDRRLHYPHVPRGAGAESLPRC